MLVAWIVPNGVSIARPPALITPFGTVWQTAQSPSAANCRPRAMVASDQVEASGRAIGAIDRHGSMAAPMPTTATHNAAAVANALRRPTNGFFHLPVGAGGFGASSGCGVDAIP